MSSVAILQAIPHLLIVDQSEWNKDNCRAMPDGQPIPVIGDQFCSVHLMGLHVDQKPDDRLLIERWKFGVTVTQRINAVPYDRLMNVWLSTQQQIYPVMERIKYRLHNRYRVLSYLNSYLTTFISSDPDLSVLVDAEFVTPPMFTGDSPEIQFHGEDWLHGSEGAGSPYPDEGFTAVSMTYVFDNLQLIAGQETEEDCTIIPLP